MNPEKEPLLQNEKLRAMDTTGKTTVYIDRPLYQQEELHEATQYQKPHKKGIGLSLLRNCNPIACLRSLFPVLEWIPEYTIKTDFLSDVISGLTVAVMHIPQGMAYGLLGNLQPIVGIYMAFFPVLVYFFFCTSRHVSMGTFAIICLMTGKVVNQYSSEDLNGHPVLSNDNDTTIVHLEEHYTSLQVATTVTFTVAIIQIAMYMLRLGALSSLLSTTLVNGFTTGAAVHVAVSQLKDLFGLKIPKRTGLFKNGFMTYDVILAIPQANHIAVVISFLAILLMSLNNELFKPWMSKKTKFPLPIELITVSLGTLISYILDLNGKYNVTLVGDIPTGLPEPTMPALSLISKVAVDSISIAIVSYAVTISMALIFAQKLSYEVDPNQELLAMGAGNLFSSFFSCMPFSASLSRSLIQQVTGGKTQIASLVSCAILLVLLLWIGPIFQFLPRCILASIIMVALKGIFMQAKDLVNFWRLSKLDAMIWLVTFIGVVFLDIEIGLAAGVIASLVVISIQSFKPYTCLLGQVPNTDLYLDTRRYKGVGEIDNIKIFHYSGGLNFASRTVFKNELYKRIQLDPKKILLARNRHEKISKIPNMNEPNENLTVKCIIIDLSALNYIDPEGVEQLRIIATEFDQINIGMYLASASGPVYETLKKCDMYENKKGKYFIFPTIHDACMFAKENILHLKNT